MVKSRLCNLGHTELFDVNMYKPIKVYMYMLCLVSHAFPSAMKQSLYIHESLHVDLAFGGFKYRYKDNLMHNERYLVCMNTDASTNDKHVIKALKYASTVL